jgi:hypothetical protein
MAKTGSGPPVICRAVARTPSRSRSSLATSASCQRAPLRVPWKSNIADRVTTIARWAPKLPHYGLESHRRPDISSRCQSNLFYPDTLADVLYAGAWADTLSTPRDSIGSDAESIMGLRMHLKELINHPPKLPPPRKSKMLGSLVLMLLRRWLPVGLKGPVVPYRGPSLLHRETVIVPQH